MKNIILGICGFLLFIFLINEFELFGVKFWGVRIENARREVFEQTKSFVDAKRQTLSKYKLEYELAKDDFDKKAIRNHILREMSDVDKSTLDKDLSDFLTMLQNQPK